MKWESGRLAHKSEKMDEFRLPQLGRYFERIGTCIVVDPASPALVRWVRKNATDDEVVKVYGDGSDTRWLEVTLEAWDDETVHLHTELTKGEPSDERKRKKRRAFAASALVKKITTFIAKAGECEAYVQLGCRLSIPRSEVPSNSTIGRLLPFSRKAGSATVQLKGAKLDIADELFKKLTFQESEDGETITVTLSAFDLIPVGIDFMLQAAELMEAGAACFVFERVSSEVSHA